MLEIRAVFVFMAFAAIAILQTAEPTSALQVVNVYADKNLEEKNGRLFYKDKPFTGVAIEPFPDGSMQKSTEYKNGFQHGITKVFGFTGARRYLWNYVDGKKHGLQYGWYLEGPKRYVRNYKAGLLHGESIEWFLHGEKFRQRFFEDGRETKVKVYYSTSELHTNYVKKDGAIYGLKAGELCMDFPKEGEIR